jgi:GAF domain-containing protein
VHLTRSKLGAISLLNEDETALTFQAWSKEIRQNASMGEGTDLWVPIESTGLWAEALRERKPLIVNDFSESSLRSESIKKIIEAHKGQVRIFDNPKRGVTFRVLIPRSHNC